MQNWFTKTFVHDVLCSDGRRTTSPSNHWKSIEGLVSCEYQETIFKGSVPEHSRDIIIIRMTLYLYPTFDGLLLKAREFTNSFTNLSSDLNMHLRSSSHFPSIQPVSHHSSQPKLLILIVRPFTCRV